MSETLQVLNNIRTLRAQTREVALEALEDILEKLTVIVSERREEEKANEEANRVHLEKLSQYREMLIADGIDPSELMSTTGIVKERKYVYTDDTGVEKTWTGQGRTPGPIQAQLNTGKSLEDFLIEK